jgi:hypothetical protein
MQSVTAMIEMARVAVVIQRDLVVAVVAVRITSAERHPGRAVQGVTLGAEAALAIDTHATKIVVEILVVAAVVIEIETETDEEVAVETDTDQTSEIRAESDADNHFVNTNKKF